MASKGGGDYWISAVSAVCNAYQMNDLSILDEKVSEIESKLNSTTAKISKNMYKRNIEILEAYKSIHSRVSRPTSKLTFLRKSTISQLLTVRGLEVQSKVSRVFTFGSKTTKVGAVWFVAKIGGYSPEELGMHCELLFRVLKHNYVSKFSIDSKHCIVVDLVTGGEATFEDIEKGIISRLLVPSLEDIKRLL